MDRRLQNLIREDFGRLLDREKLNTTPEVEKLVLVQSVEGHAHNGHGAFRQRRYVNVTVSDVVRALGLNPTEIKKKRQGLIDSVRRWAELAMRGEQPDTLTDERARPLIGIPQFAELAVKAPDVLKGIYVGARRDNLDVRLKAEEIYGVRIGGGNCYLVDTDVMKRLGFDGESLAHGAHGEEIERFREEGLIVNLPDEKVDDDRIRYMYIRHREGNGHSDDAAFVSAGVIYGRDVALGVFLADAIDTLDKYAVRYADQDLELSEEIASSSFYEEGWADAATTVAYLAASPDGEAPDSSLRYFLLIDDETDRCALESHLDFIEGRPVLPMTLSYNRVKNTVFYRDMRKKLAEYIAPAAVPASARTIESFATALNKDFIEASENDPVSEVVESFLEKGAEQVIIKDASGRVKGTLNARNLLRILSGMKKNDKTR